MSQRQEAAAGCPSPVVEMRRIIPVNKLLTHLRMTEQQRWNVISADDSSAFSSAWRNGRESKLKRMKKSTIYYGIVIFLPSGR